MVLHRFAVFLGLTCVGQFLPVIGRLVADAIQGKMEPELVRKFALDRPTGSNIVSRLGQTAELNLRELCTPEDLLPP